MKHFSSRLACAILALSFAAVLYADEPKIRFGGFEWSVRQTAWSEGPGPNWFSPRSLSESPSGILLSARERKSFLFKARYECSEIVSENVFSYGTFELDFIREGRFDSRAVFGFFLYDGGNPPNFSEVDFEASRWDRPENPEGLFTVQPDDVAGQSFPFSLPAGIGEYTARIVWTRARVDCSLLTRGGQEIGRWSYAGKSLPLSKLDPETVRVHANFWLYKGARPAGDGSLYVLLTGFRYRPERGAQK